MGRNPSKGSSRTGVEGAQTDKQEVSAALVSSPAMRSNRWLLPALTPLLLVLVTAQTALAQSPNPSASASASTSASSSPEVAAGVCAPWHRCLAMGAMGLTVIIVLVFTLGYLIQRKGFDKVEHRQGNPEGIKVD